MDDESIFATATFNLVAAKCVSCRPLFQPPLDSNAQPSQFISRSSQYYSDLTIDLAASSFIH